MNLSYLSFSVSDNYPRLTGLMTTRTASYLVFVSGFFLCVGIISIACVEPVLAFSIVGQIFLAN